MEDNWHSFLSAEGALWDEQGVRGFSGGGSAAADSGRLMALDQLGYLVVAGPEARKFLQGQVTCDMRLVTGGHSQPGGHCNTKGRMVFSFRAVQLPPEEPGSDTFALVMHRGLLETARQALAKYIVFSKARLSVGEAYRLIGLAGAAVSQRLAEWVPTIPIAGHDAVQTGQSVCIRVSGDRFLCLVERESAQQLWRRWAPHCRLGGYPDWDLATIRDGLGEVAPGSEELFIPQMLNMQLTGGVSFTKGCYIGQEVVARMQYLGKLKRHMRRVRADLVEPPTPGSPVYAGESAQSVGNVVLAAPADAGTVELLVVITDGAFDGEALYLKEQQLKEQDLKEQDLKAQHSESQHPDEQKSQKLLPLSLPYAITN